MEAYLQVYINYKENNWARLLPGAEFVYNNAKDASMSHISFELNRSYHPRLSYKKDVDSYFKSWSADKIATVLYKLIFVYKDNPQYI